MGYNSHCNYQDCSGGCCNLYGDCPEWYSNGVQQYTNCYYYYGNNPTSVIGAVVGSILGVVLIVIVVCIWYKY